MERFAPSTCPKCGGHRIKSWDQLDEEEKILVQRLPASADFAREERKKHRFCTRCWFEDEMKGPRTA